MAEIIGKKIIKLDQVDSTNNYTSKLAADDTTVEGTVVSTAFQTQGRGQVKNSWESEPYKNILLSILFCPVFLPVQHQFMLSKIVALGVRDLLSLYTEGVTIKWPNDIYVGNKKIAGILIENSIMGHTIGSSIAGIGINVNQSAFHSDAPNPVSLFQLTGKIMDTDEMVKLLCSAIDKWYGKLRSGEPEMINNTYIEAMYRFGHSALYRDNDGVYTGTISGINEIGQLQITAANGQLKTYHFKEVAFL